MTSYPHLVAGKGRFDTEFMLFFQGAFLSKGGAEAVQLVSVLNRGLGIAVKVVDVVVEHWSHQLEVLGNWFGN